MARKRAKLKRKEKIRQVKKEVNVVKEIQSRSEERPQRIVIDEVFPGEVYRYRVLSAEMKPRAKESQIIDSAAWGEEEEHYMDWKELSKLISKKQRSDVREGHVFRIKRKRVKSINKEVKKGVEEKTKNLLAREGKTQDEMRRRR